MVVLHVAGAATRRQGFLYLPATLELGEQRFVGYTQHVRQDVQAAAVSHAHHDLFCLLLSRGFDGCVEYGHEHVQPFDAEPLVPEVRPVKKCLEALNTNERTQQPALRVLRKGSAVFARLDDAAEPHALLMCRNMLEFVRDRPAVRLA